MRMRLIPVMIVCVAFIAATATVCTAESEGQKIGTILLTVFFKHDQSKTLGEINAHLDRTGFWKRFPPPGTEVVSWYVMMGIGQVVTLRIPVEKLREVNRIIEESAWGGFRTEFYATYDYKPIWQAERKAKQGGLGQDQGL